MKKLLSAKETLEYFGISKAELINLIKNEKLPFVRISGYTRFRADQLEKWLAEKTSTVDDYPGVVEEIDREIESAGEEEAAVDEAAPAAEEPALELSVSEFFSVEEMNDSLCVTAAAGSPPEETKEQIAETLADIGIVSRAAAFAGQAVENPGARIELGSVVHTFIDDVNVIVSRDKLKAYLYISPGAKGITPASVLKRVAETGVRHGLNSRLIRNAGSESARGRLLVAARGAAPDPGGEPRLVLNFDTPHGFTPRSLESPDIDFSRFEKLSRTPADQILAELLLPADACDGMNVYGEAIKYKPGAHSLLRGGANTYYSTDKLRLHAAREGIPYWKKNTICVDATRYLPEVGYDTGNIDFEGRVIVHGSVLPGFSLSAQRKILVKGHVEAAKVVSRISSVEVLGGVRGGRKALLVAKRNITTAFAERCHIHSGMNVTVESSIVGSEVYAAKSVVMTGAASRIVSSNVTAGISITAGAAGSANHNRTVLKIQQPADDGSPSELLYLQKLIANLDEEIALTKKRIKRRAQQKSTAKKKEEKKLEQLQRQLKQQEKALTTFLDWTSGDDRIFIDVAGIAYPGVEICIENAAVEIKDQMKNKRFYYYKGKIAVKDIPGT